MSSFIAKHCQDELLSRLKERYRVCAPKYVRGGKGQLRYGEIASFSELVWDRKSEFSPKEVFFPIVQTLLYFTADTVRESELGDEREILLFLRACDINAIRRLDTVYLKNAGGADNYYARLREKLHLCLLECRESFDGCFCVSMGSNVAEDYAAAFRFLEDGFYVNCKEAELESYFCGDAAEFSPEFVQENPTKVSIPNIPGTDMVAKIHVLPYWESFNDRCISCGGCSTVCPTCSCFDTTDVIYDETSREGERRRSWSSCMLADFTTMAGGHSVRTTPGERTRFKTMHKIYDFKQRFGAENMCVGCGRCALRCPKDIRFSETINGLSAEVEQILREEASGK